MSHQVKLARARMAVALLVSASCVLSPRGLPAQAGGWLTHARDSKHTAVSPVTSQPLTAIHWHVPVDLNPPTGEIFIHYGSPLVTAANTTIVPVKTGTNSFRVEAHEGATGQLLWVQSTDYQAPSAGFMPGLGSTLFSNRLFIPDNAGGVLVRKDPDVATGGVRGCY